jgi:hypothetical protein
MLARATLQPGKPGVDTKAFLYHFEPASIGFVTICIYLYENASNGQLFVSGDPCTLFL